MKASELRVGNWIEEEYGNVRQWRLEDYANYHGEQYPENEISDKIEAIPLTSEILNKCDFSAIQSSIWLLCPADLPPNGLSFKWSQSSYDFPTHILYLHQLQNLYFALTGKEINTTL